MNALEAQEVCFHCTLSRFFPSCDSVNILTCHNSSTIDPPYPVYGGIFHKEAIMLLRRFYIQENEKGICLLYQTSEFFLLML